MFDVYQLRIRTAEHGIVTCTYNESWSVETGDGRTVLDDASAENVAGYLAGLLTDFVPDMLGGLECVLHSIEAMLPAEVPF